MKKVHIYIYIYIFHRTKLEPGHGRFQKKPKTAERYINRKQGENMHGPISKFTVGNSWMYKFRSG